MTRQRLLTFILVWSSLVLQAYSYLIVNNVSISNNFFREDFLSQMRVVLEAPKIFKIVSSENQKCFLQLKEIVNQFPSPSVGAFIDSWGKFPSGILYGHLKDLGNYDQCVKTSVQLNDTIGIATGKYCTASFPLNSPTVFSEKELSLFRENPLEEKLNLFRSIKLKIGICIPETCSPQLITQIFQTMLSDVLNGTLSGVKVSGCSVGKKPEYTALDIFGIVIFSIIAGLMFLSTFYDCLTNSLEKKPIQLLLAFSITSNGRKLFMINTKKSPNSIECLTGIRVLSMIWILHCHNYMFYAIQNLTNAKDALGWYKKPWSMTVLMGTVSVDSFFLLSGLLVAWLGLRELDKTKGRLHIKRMYVHRYIRLTPALAAIILFYVSLNKFIGSGPLRANYNKVHEICEETWWVTLLYVQNYVKNKKICVMQSWYLAIDTQLYFLSPLILIPLWKWGKKCVSVLVILSFLSIGCTIATFFSRGYTSLIGFNDLDRTQTIYFPTHIRYPAWLVGICLGYFLYLNRQKSLRPPLVFRILGWIVCSGTMLSIIFAPYFTISSSQTASVGHAAAYESLKRISWSLALAWIVFACHFGFGGIVNSILSHPFWQPLGRLTYCTYLVHMAVQTICFGTIRTDVYFSDFRLYLVFWSSFGISVLAAIVLSLSFEAPILVIEKVLLARNQQQTTNGNIISSNAANKIPLGENDVKEVANSNIDSLP